MLQSMWETKEECIKTKFCVKASYANQSLTVDVEDTLFISLHLNKQIYHIVMA